jgi:hypothetical protein
LNSFLKTIARKNVKGAWAEKLLITKRKNIIENSYAFLKWQRQKRAMFITVLRKTVYLLQFDVIALFTSIRSPTIALFLHYIISHFYAPLCVSPPSLYVRLSFHEN